MLSTYTFCFEIKSIKRKKEIEIDRERKKEIERGRKRKKEKERERKRKKEKERKRRIRQDDSAKMEKKTIISKSSLDKFYLNFLERNLSFSVFIWK